jgi:hypothetical protein
VVIGNENAGFIATSPRVIPDFNRALSKNNSNWVDQTFGFVLQGCLQRDVFAPTPKLTDEH